MPFGSAPALDPVTLAERAGYPLTGHQRAHLGQVRGQVRIDVTDHVPARRRPPAPGRPLPRRSARTAGAEGVAVRDTNAVRVLSCGSAWGRQVRPPCEQEPEDQPGDVGRGGRVASHRLTASRPARMTNSFRAVWAIQAL